jgi:hypothetical protein
MRRHRHIEMKEARLPSTKFAPGFKALRRISLKSQTAGFNIRKAAEAVYRDGDCRPDDAHDIWDRIRRN